MRKIIIICTIIVTLAVPIFIVSFAQNISVRTEEVYSFYFNDTRVVNKLHTSYSSNEVARMVANYLNSFSNESFQIWEDNGYDLEAVFTEEESHNMGQLKKALAYSSLTCVVSLAVICGIYLFFFLSERKILIRRTYLISIPFTIAGIVFGAITALNQDWQYRMAENLNFIELGEESLLGVVFGSDLMVMVGKLFLAVSIILFAACSFVAYKLSKDDKVFSQRRR